MHATFPNLLALFNLGRWDELLVLLEEHVAAFREDPAIACQFVRDGPLIGATTLMLMGRTTAAAELAALVGDPLSDLESASAWQARYEVIAGRPEVAVAIARPKVLEGRTRGPRYADAVIEAEVAMEDWDELTEVLRVARDSAAGNALLEPVCDRAEGALENARGQRQQARRLLGRSLARFDLMGMKYEAARTRELLAAVEPAATRHALRRAARKTYEELGVPVGPTTV